MEVVSIIMEFFRIIVWPSVTIIVFYYLRQPLKKLVQDIRRIKYGETSIELEQRTNQVTNIDSQEMVGLTSGKSNIPISKALDSYSEETTKMSEKIVKEKLGYDKLNTDEERITALLVYAKVSLFYNQMMQIYNFIYGSQIKLMQKLNADGQVQKEKVKSYYEMAKEVWMEAYKDYSFDQYLFFLQNYNLITISQNEILSITYFGKDFLRFLVDNNLSTEKVF